MAAVLAASHLIDFKSHKKFEEQPSEQPFDENKNGSRFGCLVSC
jgi:hypothetical protein